MLTKRKWPSKALSTFSAAALIALAGCQPSGPKSLLQGQEYIQKKEYSKAVKTLSRASELMPGHPQVWNHLGLAYHGAGQPEKALQAYRQALQIDRNLAPVRYNLGMLFLSQNRLNEAVGEFSAFTLLQPNQAEGWKGLGTALFHAGKPDEAERALERAARMASGDAEVFNLLGLVHLQRKRPREAVQAFNAALRAQPGYPAALLNQAIVAEQYFNNPQAALERYRAYLTTKPPAPKAAEIGRIIESLERQLNPPPSVAVAPPPPATNPPALQPATTNVAVAAPAVRTNSLPAAATNQMAGRTPATTNRLAGPTPGGGPPQTNVAMRTTNRTEQTVAAVTPPPVPEKTNAAAPAKVPVVALPSTNPPPAEVEPERAVAVEVVEVPAEPQFKLPVSPAPAAETAPPAKATNETILASASPAMTEERPLFAPRGQEPTRPGIAERLNPLGWFRRGEEKESTIPPPAVRIPRTEPVKEQAAPPPPRNFPRYPFRTTTPAGAGTREEAEQFFQEGARAHAAGRLSEAVPAYRKSIAADPTLFDAHYNLGVAAYQAKDLPLALAANEQAVKLKPDAVDARYNFAMTLRDANYPVDAANQLRELLVEAPDETRAHLALGNLYAQQLGEPVLARRHYQRVIELEPHHRQAAVIREWLAATQ